MKGQPLDPRANHDPDGRICLLPVRAKDWRAERHKNTARCTNNTEPVTIDLDALREANDTEEGRAPSIEVKRNA